MENTSTHYDNVTFLDFETTGLKDPMPVSLALIRVQNNQIVFAKYYLINPEKTIEPSAIVVHGITQNTVQDKPNFANIWHEIQPYISGQIICGHNIKYDAGVILNCIQRYALPCEDFYTICTYQNAKRMIAKNLIDNYKLDTVCNYLNIGFSNHHDARADTEGCMKIFNKLQQMGSLTMNYVKIKGE